MTRMQRPVHVVGVGMIPFTKPGASDPYTVMGARAAKLALEDAGVDPSRFGGRVGVYAGSKHSQHPARVRNDPALAEMPGDTGALEHLGELRAAQEKYDEAILLYEKVIARIPRPEFWQALGDVYAAMGKTAPYAVVLASTPGRPLREIVHDQITRNARPTQQF